MLLQFTVENFLSFRDETTFSMLAAGADAQHPAHLVQNAAGKGRSALRATALYGANGAGKSALIKAIGFAQNLILRGRRSGQPIPVNPFKLSAKRGEASKFDFTFTYQGVQYAYGFKVNATQVLEEWLYGTPNKQEVAYFERQTTDKGKAKIEFGAQMKGKNKKQEQFLEFVAEGTRPNQLFLTEAEDRNIESVKPVIEWFRKVLLIISADAEAQDLEMTLHQDANFTDFLCSLLQRAGTGIEGIATEEVPLDFDHHFPGIPDEFRKELLENIRDSEKNHFVMLRSDSGARHILTQNKEGAPLLIKFRTQRLAEDRSLTEFEAQEESDGTRRLIHLAPALFGLKGRRESVVLIDELDRRLHTLLSKAFIEAFLDCDDMNRKNQLIFTTHDTNLLDLDLLRRDEICFVEKDKEGASHLASLSEFKIRPDLQIEKGYLNGRFGAIPFLGNLCDLGWAQTENETQAEVLPA